MEMLGNRHLAISQQQAWTALNDPAVLKACIPGCEHFESTGTNQYSVGLAVKIGPVSARFSGKVLLSGMDPPHGYTIAFEGQGGAAGFGKGTSAVRLTSHAEGCVLDYSVNAQVGGKIAQLGQRLVDSAARSMADDFFKRFDAEMRRLHPATQPGATATAGTPPADDPGHRPAHLTWSRWRWAAIAAAFGAAAWSGARLL